MSRSPQRTVKLYVPEIQALDELKSALRAAYGVKASREDIVGAMAHGVSVHQLSGILSEFLKHPEWGAPADSVGGE